MSDKFRSLLFALGGACFIFAGILGIYDGSFFATGITRKILTIAMIVIGIIMIGLVIIKREKLFASKD